jgi:hypothetical protein
MPNLRSSRSSRKAFIRQLDPITSDAVSFASADASQMRAGDQQSRVVAETIPAEQYEPDVPADPLANTAANGDIVLISQDAVVRIENGRTGWHVGRHWRRPSFKIA